MQVSLLSPPESRTHHTPVKGVPHIFGHLILLASIFCVRPLGISSLLWWAHDRHFGMECKRICFWARLLFGAREPVHPEGTYTCRAHEASVTCVLSARVISAVSREIHANHVLVYLPSTLLFEITTKQNKTLTHTDTLRFMYMGYIGAHVH